MRSINTLTLPKLWLARLIAYVDSTHMHPSASPSLASPKKFPFAITMQHVDRSRCGSRAYNPAPRSSHLSPILMNDTMKSRYPHPFDGLATAIHIHIE